MRKFITLITGIIISVVLSAQTLPKGMTDLTAGIAANDPDFHLTTQDDRPSPKTSVLTINESGTKMFFTANSGAAGNELWVTDGTAAGTQMVKDINSGTANSNPTLLTLIGDILYFTADDGTHGVELWMSDGTSANTKMVADIYGGSKSSSPMLLNNFNGKLLFWAQDVISAADNAFYMYIYDPAKGGAPTMISKTQGNNAGDSNYGNVVIFAKKNLAFFISDPSTAGTGQEIWVTDGTSAGTKLCKDVWPGAGASSLQWLTNYNDSAVVWRENTPIGYAGADSVNYNTTLGAQLWVSDGTTTGTHLLSFYDKVAGTDGKGPDTQFAWAKYFPEVKGMFFRADDGVHGVELGISNGKDAAGTHMVADINEGSGASWPEDWAIYHGYVCFDAASNVYGAQPSYWDPKSQSVKLMSNVYPGGWAWCRYLTTVQVAGKDSFLYSVGANATSGSELFVSNGIGNVADLVVDMGPGNSNPTNLRNWKDALYLTYTSFPRLYKVVYTPKAAINPLTALNFDDSNWNDTLAFVIEKKHAEMFTNKKIKADILGTDNSFRICNLKKGTYGFSSKTAGNDIVDTLYVIAGKYLNPDEFVHNVKLRLTSPGVDTLTLFINSTVAPSFRYEKLYHVVCGADTNNMVGITLGEYNSTFDQLYGADGVSGKKWGYASSDWSMTGPSQWSGEREIHDKAFGPGKGMIYKFQVDNGSYMVWVGFHEFWGSRAEKLKITGVDTINLTTPSSYEWYKNKVTVIGGEIEVDVQCAKDNGYLNNIIIGKIGTETCYDALCSLRDSLYKSTTTGFTNVTINHDISLYPNPSNGLLTLKADPGRYRNYEVVDMTGRLILRGKIIDNNTIIDLSNKSGGIYIIKTFRDINNISFQKVIIQR